MRPDSPPKGVVGRSAPSGGEVVKVLKDDGAVVQQCQVSHGLARILTPILDYQCKKTIAEESRVILSHGFDCTTECDAEQKSNLLLVQRLYQLTSLRWR